MTTLKISIDNETSQFISSAIAFIFDLNDQEIDLEQFSLKNYIALFLCVIKSKLETFKEDLEK